MPPDGAKGSLEDSLPFCCSTSSSLVSKLPNAVSNDANDSVKKPPPVTGWVLSLSAADDANGSAWLKDVSWSVDISDFSLSPNDGKEMEKFPWVWVWAEPSSVVFMSEADPASLLLSKEVANPTWVPSLFAAWFTMESLRECTLWVSDDPDETDPVLIIDTSAEDATDTVSAIPDSPRVASKTEDPKNAVLEVLSCLGNGESGMDACDTWSGSCKQ